jgi:hypothetical protein
VSLWPTRFAYALDRSLLFFVKYYWCDIFCDTNNKYRIQNVDTKGVNRWRTDKRMTKKKIKRQNAKQWYTKHQTKKRSERSKAYANRVGHRDTHFAFETSKVTTTYTNTFLSREHISLLHSQTQAVGDLVQMHDILQSHHFICLQMSSSKQYIMYEICSLLRNVFVYVVVTLLVSNV